jgi:hypothetical protein
MSSTPTPSTSVAAQGWMDDIKEVAFSGSVEFSGANEDNVAAMPRFQVSINKVFLTPMQNII